MTAVASRYHGTGAFARRLNLGCGSRFRHDWTNVDVVAGHGVLAHDLRDPLPFADGTFDFVYHSHVLEHFRFRDAPAFLAECRRVLRPGGVMRVAVPDLERIAREYLAALGRVDADEPGARDDLDWMTLELYDQTVRERSGGAMAAALRREEVPNEAFILSRIGMEGENLLATRDVSPEARLAGRGGLSQIPRAVARRVREGFSPARWRAAALQYLLAGEDAESLRIGRFRQAGEVHQWMYDRVSLAAALRQAGFGDITLRAANESFWPDWAEQHLDTEPDGQTYKPDSLYMEAVKPVAAPPPAGGAA